MKKQIKRTAPHLRILTLFLLTQMLFVGVSYGQDFLESGYKLKGLENINTETSEICPVLLDGKLYYSAIRDEYAGNLKLLKKNKAFYNVYDVSMNRYNGLTQGEKQVAEGFTGDYHLGPIAYCAKTGELFATRSNVLDPSSTSGVLKKINFRLELITLEKQGDMWVLKEEFPYNNNLYHVAHPAISVSGDTLIFSSDMHIKKTKKHEAIVSMGKSDLFMSVRDADGVWSRPVNLGDVVNTSGNEMFPTFLPDGRLCFSSNGRADGVGKLDLYCVDFPGLTTVTHLEGDINSVGDDFHFVMNDDMSLGYFSSDRSGNDDIYLLRLSERKLKGLVVDAVTGLPIVGAAVELSDCSGNKLFSTPSSKEGTFTPVLRDNSCLKSVVTKPGYYVKELDVSGKTDIRIEMMPKYHDVKIVDAETKAVISGASIVCGEENVNTSNAEGMSRFYYGSDLSCSFKVEHPDYLSKRFTLNKDVFSGSAPGGIDVVYLYKKEKNKNFVLDNIYYDLNKWNILPESSIELNKLVVILEDNPTLEVELGSHTDSRGSDSYNKRLSQKRSDSAVSYIISKGIAKNRIKAKGYGETRLVNGCKNGVKCSEAEHRKNRRTEFTILNF